MVKFYEQDFTKPGGITWDKRPDQIKQHIKTMKNQAELVIEELYPKIAHILKITAIHDSVRLEEQRKQAAAINDRLLESARANDYKGEHDVEIDDTDLVYNDDPHDWMDVIYSCCIKPTNLNEIIQTPADKFESC